ncbi:MAG: class II aldolase/adducin family protein [Phycisphaeraceae bacterium]|nr:class II aldolase/adducin family protein [Phycisphaeraceae bacterium]
MSQDLEDLKQLICRIGQRLWQRGYCAGNDGNLSVRLEEQRLLATATGLSKGFMDPATVRTTDLDGHGLDETGPAPSTEIKMHAAIYRARPEVRAVVHSHAPHATAFALAGRPLPEGVYPEAEVLLGRVPLVPFELPGTAALAEAVADALSDDTWAVLLANHGAVTFSDKGLLDAYHRMEVLDASCRILSLCDGLGGARRLSDEQLRQVLEAKRDHYGLNDGRLEKNHE